MRYRQIAARGTSPGQRVRTSWDAHTEWYDGWVGKDGSTLHRELAIPATLELLAPRRGERILDIGAGQGVLAPHITRAGASYVGIDASTRLLQRARAHHGRIGTFLQGDASRLDLISGIEQATFDGIVFLLSIQDMDPLSSVLEGAAWALRGGGRLVIVMIHPCFRVPRQSGWGWQEERQLQYRRIDRYLTPLAVPMKEYANGRQGQSLCFHRPLQQYINDLASSGLVLDQMRELCTYKTSSGPHARAENRAYQEIPLFMGLRARKLPSR
ncbi:class I SAM-dependent methyltransferase [Ktedonobacter sp. SOSP1-85]|uniref:class I SAM-dependent methyltransferase n=1 Tax=Ktedonobacter sp. SOSP1-85 TaxID=2778367 RepID=UPI0019160295|nr:class I SAM-dependent methyltransferase [Ktedonobacter sp. SOSP1-85]